MGNHCFDRRFSLFTLICFELASAWRNPSNSADRTVLFNCINPVPYFGRFLNSHFQRCSLLLSPCHLFLCIIRTGSVIPRCGVWCGSCSQSSCSKIQPTSIISPSPTALWVMSMTSNCSMWPNMIAFHVVRLPFSFFPFFFTVEDPSESGPLSCCVGLASSTNDLRENTLSCKACVFGFFFTTTDKKQQTETYFVLCEWRV